MGLELENKLEISKSDFRHEMIDSAVFSRLQPPPWCAVPCFSELNQISLQSTARYLLSENSGSSGLWTFPISLPSSKNTNVVREILRRSNKASRGSVLFLNDSHLLMSGKFLALDRSVPHDDVWSLTKFSPGVHKHFRHTIPNGWCTVHFPLPSVGSFSH